MPIYALMGAFAVQADVGDWDAAKHAKSLDYISQRFFVPEHHQTALLPAIAEIHKDLVFAALHSTTPLHSSSTQSVS